MKPAQPVTRTFLPLKLFLDDVWFINIVLSVSVKLENIGQFVIIQQKNRQRQQKEVEKIRSYEVE